MRGLRGVGIQGLAHPVFSAAHPENRLFNVIMSYNPIAYWPLNETSGTTAINYGTLGAAANGTYSGPTLNQIAAPGGITAPYFDGVNDYVDVSTSTLHNALNTPNTILTFLVWSKVDAAFWIGDYATLFTTRNLVVGEQIRIYRTLDNNLQYYYFATGTVAIDLTTNSTLWQMYSITVSTLDDEFKAYQNGAQTGITKAVPGVFHVGESHLTYIGTDQWPFFWNGYISHACIFSSALTADDIAKIYAAGTV